jgi:hypothetical protein
VISRAARRGVARRPRGGAVSCARKARETGMSLAQRGRRRRVAGRNAAPREPNGKENPMLRPVLIPALAAALAFAADARAGDVYCPPSLGPVTIDGNVRVDGGCTLDRTNVDGNVFVQRDGNLVAKRANVGGNVQTDGDGPRRVRLIRTDVGGSVQLEKLVAPQPSILDRSRVGGSVQAKENRSPIAVLDNVVGADVQAFSNRGGVRVELNEIDGNLQCKENVPAPTGYGNVVGGNKEDQCRRF